MTLTGRQLETLHAIEKRCSEVQNWLKENRNRGTSGRELIAIGGERFCRERIRGFRGCLTRFRELFDRSPSGSESTAHSRALSALRKSGLITDGDLAQLTDAGRAALKQK